MLDEGADPAGRVKLARVRLTPEHSSQCRATAKAARSFVNGVMNALPGFARRLGYGPRLSRRQCAMALEVSRGPDSDLRDRERRQMQRAANLALRRKERRERRSTRKPAGAGAEGKVKPVPSLAIGFGDRSVEPFRPAPGSRVESVSPFQDLSGRERGRVRPVPHLAPRREQAGQAHAAGQPAEPMAKGRVDPRPRLIGGVHDEARLLRRPAPRALVEGVSPTEYPADAEAREPGAVPDPAALG